MRDLSVALFFDGRTSSYTNNILYEQNGYTGIYVDRLSILT
jgi:hypothetical protein